LKGILRINPPSKNGFFVLKYLDLIVIQMKAQVASLISASNVLTPERKKTYLRVLKFLSEEQLKTLLWVLQKEQASAEEIRKTAEKEKSALNKQYIQKAETFYKKGFKSAVSEEEREDKSQAENMLTKIDKDE